MKESKQKTQITSDQISQTIRSAGIAGAGGAGFPSYAKWSDLEKIQYLLVNLQESEPILYSDKWLVKENPESFKKLFKLLLNLVFDVVVIGTKEKYRKNWLKHLENVTDSSIYLPDDLPLDVESETGVTIAYTEDVYQHSEELPLLKVTTGTIVSPDLPTEHGWITHNTETIYNIYRALFEGAPMTKKYVTVGGDTPRHRCLEAPIGTTIPYLLETAGLNFEDMEKSQILLEGGPGWCSRIEENPLQFGVSKRTNAVMVMDRKTVEEHRMENEEVRINLLDARNWEKEEHEKEPTEIKPDKVRIPLITNPALQGTVKPSEPIVSSGDYVGEGEVIATPYPEGISIPQHASIDGKIVNVSKNYIVIERN